MQRIKSFDIDHTKLNKGLYLSRIDGDVTTYDIRLKRPNTEPVMANDVIHTIEHLFATFVRNSRYKDNIIYFGPMGCRTGFYFLTRDLENQRVLDLTREAFKFIADYQGEIPGATEIECGNYKDHNLQGAKDQAAEVVTILKHLNVLNMQYTN